MRLTQLGEDRQLEGGQRWSLQGIYPVWATLSKDPLFLPPPSPCLRNAELGVLFRTTDLSTWCFSHSPGLASQASRHFPSGLLPAPQPVHIGLCSLVCADLSVAPSADLYVCPVSVSVSFSPSLLLPRFSLFLPVSPAALSGAGLCVLPGPCTSPQIPANLCLLPLSLSFGLGLCLTLRISGLAVSDYTSLSLFLCCVCLHLWLLQRGEIGLGEGSKGATFPLPCWSLCLLREVRLASLSPAE